MSQRGVEFLRGWISENVKSADYPPIKDTRAKVLAEQCAADAGKVGISVGEIEVETGDLADCMLKAMDEVSRHCQTIQSLFDNVNEFHEQENSIGGRRRRRLHHLAINHDPRVRAGTMGTACKRRRVDVCALRREETDRHAENPHDQEAHARKRYRQRSSALTPTTETLRYFARSLCRARHVALESVRLASSRGPKPTQVDESIFSKGGLHGQDCVCSDDLHFGHCGGDTWRQERSRRREGKPDRYLEARGSRERGACDRREDQHLQGRGGGIHYVWGGRADDGRYRRFGSREAQGKRCDG